jgi:effector-binding domain-containing protein
MRNKNSLGVVLIAVAFVAGIVAVAGASPNQELARSAVQTVPRMAVTQADTVLYTVVRGSYSEAVRAFHSLVELRNDMGLSPAGDWGAFVYLTVPDTTDGTQLIEVQIPVGSDGVHSTEQAQSAASIYKLGTTGVKSVAAKTVVKATKPVGVSDPTALYKNLYSYIDNSGMSVSGGAIEQFSNVEAIPDTCALEELETTISVPVS